MVLSSNDNFQKLEMCIDTGLVVRCCSSLFRERFMNPKLRPLDFYDAIHFKLID